VDHISLLILRPEPSVLTQLPFLSASVIFTRDPYNQIPLSAPVSTLHPVGAQVCSHRWSEALRAQPVDHILQILRPGGAPEEDAPDIARLNHQPFPRKSPRPRPRLFRIRPSSSHPVRPSHSAPGVRVAGAAGAGGAL